MEKHFVQNISHDNEESILTVPDTSTICVKIYTIDRPFNLNIKIISDWLDINEHINSNKEKT